MDQLDLRMKLLELSAQEVTLLRMKIHIMDELDTISIIRKDIEENIKELNQQNK